MLNNVDDFYNNLYQGTKMLLAVMLVIPAMAVRKATHIFSIAQ